MKQLNYSAFTPNPKFPAAKIIPDAGLKGKMDRPDYDMIGALSCSVLKKWLELESTPSEFGWWLKDRWVDVTSSAALSMGSALDCILLEEGLFDAKFMAFTREGPKRVTDKHREDNPGKIVLTYEQLQTAFSMAKALRESPATACGRDFELLGKEVAVARVFGIPFKCEFDMWDSGSEEICDLKSAKDVTRKGFAKAFVDYGYDYQATLYLAIANALGFAKRAFNFICVKNEAPFTVKAYRFRPYANDKHREIYDGCLNRIGMAADSLIASLDNNFADDDSWEDLTLPEWSVRQRKAEALLELA